MPAHRPDVGIFAPRAVPREAREEGDAVRIEGGSLRGKAERRRHRIDREGHVVEVGAVQGPAHGIHRDRAELPDVAPGKAGHLPFGIENGVPVPGGDARHR